jgi:hypothetical protein
MGYYINPLNESKEAFINRHATFIIESWAPTMTWEKIPEGQVLVCWVNNGTFTAAGICFSKQKMEAFAHPDGRPKVWALLPEEVVKPFLHGQRIIR